jgi:uncharacterized membrane protein
MTEAGSSNSNATLKPARVLAVLTLIPGVPLLLASIAALALFYLAPGRFSALLAQMPGERWIRAALAFTPAAALGVIILALLYALERPHPEAQAEQGDGAGLRVDRALMLLALPGLLLSVTLLGLSIVAPGRFGLLIEPLPGDRFLRWALWLPPLPLLGLVLLGVYWNVRQRGPDAWFAARWAAGLTLSAAAPMLLISWLVLALYIFNRERFTSMLARLSEPTFVRMALLLFPVVLLLVVMLAGLYLFSSRKGALQAPRDSRPAPLWLLSAGLILTTATGMGLLGGVLYLLLRAG